MMTFAVLEFVQNPYLVFAIQCFFGFNVMPCFSVFKEFCCEEGYPVPEGSVTGFLICGSQIMAILFVNFNKYEDFSGSCSWISFRREECYEKLIYFRGIDGYFNY